MSEQLEKVLLEHTYPLLHSFSLPPPRWADDKKEQVSISKLMLGGAKSCMQQSRGWGTDNFSSCLYVFFLQERLQYIAEFSRKPHLSTMLAADTNQTATNIAEQMFSIYRHDLCV